MTPPTLIDCRTIMEHYGLSRYVTEVLMEKCGIVRVPGVRRYYVEREKVEKVLRG